MSTDLSLLQAQIAELRTRIEEESLARARGLNPALGPVSPTNRAPERSGFQVYRYGAGGFDKVIVTAGKVVTRSGVTSYAEKTFTFTAAGELFARYEIATSGGGAAWEVASSHVIQQAASLPAHADGFVLIPIASIGWNATDSRVSTVTVHHTGTLKHIELPAGILAPWNGSIASIPAGWAHATALNDKFLVGAGTTYAVDDTDGSTTHSHAVNETIPKQHKHPTVTVQSGTGVDVYGGADECDFITDGGLYCGDASPSDTHWTMTTNSASSLPPYTAKAWMVKL